MEGKEPKLIGAIPKADLLFPYTHQTLSEQCRVVHFFGLWVVLSCYCNPAGNIFQTQSVEVTQSRWWTIHLFLFWPKERTDQKEHQIKAPGIFLTKNSQESEFRCRPEWHDWLLPALQTEGLWRQRMPLLSERCKLCYTLIFDKNNRREELLCWLCLSSSLRI